MNHNEEFKHKSFKVGYIVYNESIRSGLIRTQVITLLKTISPKDKEIKITLIAFLSVLDLIFHRHYYNNLKIKCKKSAINCILVPIPSMHNRISLLNPINIIFYMVICIPLLYIIIKELQIDCLHARSYQATLISYLTKKIFFKKIKIIFDMRSIFPEEFFAGGVFGKSTYRMWKYLESVLIKNADVIVGVSPPFRDYVYRNWPEAQLEIIPCCVQTKLLKFNQKARDKIRNTMNLSDNDILFVYSGSFGHWNKLKTYLKFFKQARQIFPTAKLLILTNNKNILKFKKDSLENIYFINASDTNVRAEYFSAADFGLQIWKYDFDCGTRLGVKVVEYLSCGLPIIITKNVGGAYWYVKRYGIGVVVSSNESFNELQKLLRGRGSMRKKCRKFAKTHFSVESASTNYINIYKKFYRGEI